MLNGVNVRAGRAIFKWVQLVADALRMRSCSREHPEIFKAQAVDFPNNVTVSPTGWGEKVWRIQSIMSPTSDSDRKIHLHFAAFYLLSHLSSRLPFRCHYGFGYRWKLDKAWWPVTTLIERSTHTQPCFMPIVLSILKSFPTFQLCRYYLCLFIFSVNID